MQQFNLDIWLQDKSRKVVTRIGEEVKIIDTNAPDKNDPIVGYIYHKQKWNGPWSWHIDGVYKVGGDDMDLFFADEEEEPASEDLEDAAYHFCMDEFGNPKESLFEFDQRCFIAGAEWQKQQMMKDAVDAFVNTYENSDDSNYMKFVTEQSPYKFKELEKCKLIIVKGN